MTQHAVVVAHTDRICSASKSIYCSCREPGFGSKHPHGGAQPSRIEFPWDLMPAFGF